MLILFYDDTVNYLQTECFRRMKGNEPLSESDPDNGMEQQRQARSHLGRERMTLKEPGELTGANVYVCAYV